MRKEKEIEVDEIKETAEEKKIDQDFKNNQMPNKNDEGKIKNLHIPNQNTDSEQPITSQLLSVSREIPIISEDDINMELKRLENEDISLYTLEEQYQSYLNMNNLDSESLQEKFNSLKHLLQILGIPYIESPSEAEAQCAFLESKGLVDGIITEDSDVFLFGGRKIYRGVFRKRMEAYKMEKIEKELGLGREKLILLAMFLGSDYTLGIKGVGLAIKLKLDYYRKRYIYK
jgi:hypothetical protein